MGNNSAGQMLIEAIKARGGDGLCNSELECGCGIESLAPCESCNMDDCEVAIGRGEIDRGLGGFKFYMPLDGRCAFGAAHPRELPEEE